MPNAYVLLYATLFILSSSFLNFSDFINPNSTFIKITIHKYIAIGKQERGRIWKLDIQN